MTESAKWAKIILAGRPSPSAFFLYYFLIGTKLEGKGVKVTARALSRECGIPQRTCCRTWARRKELEEKGVIQRRKGQGRKRSAAFATPAAKRRAIEVMEDLKVGEHLPDAAVKLKCSVSTVQRHTKGAVTWKVSPLQDQRGHTPVVEAKRRTFASKQLTPTQKLRKAMGNATHLDHKQVHAFGLNRSHQLQCRAKGSKKPLRPKLKQNYNPKVQCFFAANKVGTEVHIHAEEVEYKTKEGTHLSHEKVTGTTLAAAVTKTMVPFMKRTGSTLAIMDCVRVNHCPEVVAAFKEGGIDVYPSAGDPHNVEGGFPPYTHRCSILDGCLFRPYQSEIAQIYMQLAPQEGRTSLCALMDQIPPLWTSRKYVLMARKAVKKQAEVLVALVASRGAV